METWEKIRGDPNKENNEDNANNIMQNLLGNSRRSKEEEFLGNFSGLQRNYKMAKAQKKEEELEKTTKVSSCCRFFVCLLYMLLNVIWNSYTYNVVLAYWTTEIVAKKVALQDKVIYEDRIAELFYYIAGALGELTMFDKYGESLYTGTGQPPSSFITPVCLSQYLVKAEPCDKRPIVWEEGFEDVLCSKPFVRPDDIDSRTLVKFKAWSTLKAPEFSYFESGGSIRSIFQGTHGYYDLAKGNSVCFNPTTPAEAQEMVLKLGRESDFFAYGARAYILSATVRDPNTELLVNVNLLGEESAAGDFQLSRTEITPFWRQYPQLSDGQENMLYTWRMLMLIWNMGLVLVRLSKSRKPADIVKGSTLIDIAIPVLIFSLQCSVMSIQLSNISTYDALELPPVDPGINMQQ